MRKRKTNAVISKTKVLCGFRDAVRREPFGQTGIVPVGAQHEWRTHDHPAAPIKPSFLSARNRQPIFVQQRDLPLKLDAASVSPSQFRPFRFGPKTPG